MHRTQRGHIKGKEDATCLSRVPDYVFSPWLGVPSHRRGIVPHTLFPLSALLHRRKAYLHENNIVIVNTDKKQRIEQIYSNGVEKRLMWRSNNKQQSTLEGSCTAGLHRLTLLVYSSTVAHSVTANKTPCGIQTILV